MHASFEIALTIVVTGPGSIELAKQGHDASWLGVAVGLAYGLMAFGATTLGLHWLLHTLHQRRFCPSVA